jgi:streptomycin 6-kinase
MTPPFATPPAFTAQAARDERFRAFVDRLPRLVADLLDDWALGVDGDPWHGHGAVVLPVRTTGGRPAALKVTYPHDEAEHEHLGLQAWHGNGTVQLLRADPRRWALLLERLHGDEDLGTIDALEACEVVAGFYPRLHVPALPQLRRLSTYVATWTDRLAALPVDAPVPHRLVEQAVSLGRDLASDPGTDARMIHGDLHYANVLAGDREPWLVIDPKPVAGDPHYEVAPLLWNRWDEVVASGDVRAAVRRRFHTVVDAAGLDEERARDWVVVRELHNVLWCIEDAERARTPLDADDRAYVTRAVSVAKAVQG